MSITIYHNPRCSKSRQTLELIREAGIEPTIVEYMKHPPSTDTLWSLLEQLNLSPGDLIRRNEQAFKDLNLDDGDGDALVEAMSTEPRLVQRPIVVTEKSACLGRPPENVLPLLEQVKQ